MSKFPSMPFLIDRYIADTRHLSLEEHGAYLLLLFAMWKRGGELIDNDRDNAQILGIPVKTWKRLKVRLMPFFLCNGIKLTNKRLSAQLTFAAEMSLRQSNRGKAGAKARWQRKQTLKSSQGNGQSNAQAMPATMAETMAGRWHPNKKDITTTSKVAAREEAEIQPSPDGAAHPDGSAPPALQEKKSVSYLLETPLMKRAGLKE